jgi:hypothetical protein
MNRSHDPALKTADPRAHHRPRARLAALTAGSLLAVLVSAAPAHAAASTYNVSLFSGTPNTFASSFSTSAYGDPESDAIDPVTGDLYVGDYTNVATVDRVSSTGAITRFLGGGATAPSTTPIAGTSASIGYVTAVTFDGSGDLFVIASLPNSQSEILEVTPSDQVTVVAGGGATAVTNGTTISPATSADIEPEAIAVDASGDLFLGDNENERVEEVTPAGLTVIAGNGVRINSNQIAPVDTTVPATASPLWAPAGIVLAPTGQIYVSLERDNQIVEFTPGSHLSIVAGLVSRAGAAATDGPATSTALYSPGLLTPDAAGDIYFTDFQNSVVEEFDPSSGQLTRVAGETGTSANPTYGQPALSTSLNVPLDVAVGLDGTLYIADDSVPSIDAITPQVPALQSAPSVSPSSALTPGEVLTATGGTWSNNPTRRSYQWQDCDASGQNCVNVTGATAITYTLAPGDVGHTVRVIVSAANAGGISTAADSAATDTVSAPASSTTVAPTTSTTSTTTTVGATTPPASDADAVSLSDGALKAGLQSSASGQVTLPLQCPQVVTGVCEASGALSIGLHITAASTADVQSHSMDSTAADTIIAQFAGLQVRGGQQALVATSLSPAAISYLRTHGIYRVRVTLALTTTLSSGQSIHTTQHVWLYVDRLTGCQAASGRLTYQGIGRLALGLSRHRTHQVGHHRRTPNGFEHYCVAGGQIRVAYSSRPLAHARHIRVGRVDIALTANHHYGFHGVHTGMTANAVKRRLRLGPPITIGRNAWYFVAGRRATRILKVQHGKIREIGVTSHAAAHTRTQERFLLRHLK